MKLQLTIVFILITPLIFGQGNLVPNPSFEMYGTCPYSMDQIYYANSWIPITLSTDYYNDCSISNTVSVPSNIMGYQYPSNGKGYAGLYARAANCSDYHEIIGCLLLDSLTVGQLYYLSFKVSPADEYHIFVNNIGMLFSKTININLMPSQNIYIQNRSHLHSDSIVPDVLNWTIISGSFTADSAYKYLLIGNFIQILIPHILFQVNLMAHIITWMKFVFQQIH